MNLVILQAAPLDILTKFGLAFGQIEVFGAIILLGLGFHFYRRGLGPEVGLVLAVLLTQAMARSFHGIFDGLSIAVLVVVLGAFAYGAIKKMATV